MSKVFLTDTKCSQAQNIVDDLVSYPGRIKSSVTTFDYAINDATIKSWITDTEVGKQLRENVVKNNDSLNSLSNAIQELCQSTSTLVIESKRQNSSK